jgi:hypothetical protein
MALTSGVALANTIETEINQTRDYIAQGKMKDGVLAPAKLSGAVPITKGGTGATTASAARTALGAAPTSHTHSQYASRNALSAVYAVADITTSPSHALGMFYRADIARPVIRVDATDFPVATWPSTADDLYAVIEALTARVAELEARLP